MTDWWQWVALAGAGAALLALDLGVLRPRSLRAAAVISAWWLVAGIGFAGVVWAWQGPGLAGEYLAGYAIERSLSLDNVFGVDELRQWRHPGDRDVGIDLANDAPNRGDERRRVSIRTDDEHRLAFVVEPVRDVDHQWRLAVERRNGDALFLFAAERE